MFGAENETGATRICDPETVWREFIEMMTSIEETSDDQLAEKVRPLPPVSKEMICALLRRLKASAPPPQEWKTRAFRQRGNRLVFAATLAPDGELFTFTFEVYGDRWFFSHLETIQIPLWSVPPLPASSFPDLPEPKKAWMREEIQTTENARLFTFLKREKGREFALSWFRDGEGYFVAARAWLPLLSEQEAFILYLCWEQSVLRGNHVTLEHLDETRAKVCLQPIYLKLYDTTSHLREMISREDYLAIFETVWKDRARVAGWGLEMSYDGTSCVMEFTR